MSGSRWPRLIGAALCVIAISAALITTHTLLRSWRDTADATPLAPGLAALSDRQLADLLPRQSDFPASWTVSDTKKPSDMFGYFRYHVSDDGLGFSPVECFAVFGVASTGAYDAAEVFGHDATGPEGTSDPKDIHLMIAREFDPNGFDTMIGVVSRCSRFTSAAAGSYAARIIEDSRPAGGPQRFRYSVTTTLSGAPAAVTRTDYFSFARQSRLILSGSASAGHEQVFDTLFDNTVHRIGTR
jgi:hypothetical protein